MINYKSIIADFEKLAKNHKQINSFSTGDITQMIYWTQQIDGQDNDDNNAPVYPLMYVIPNSVSREEQVISRTVMQPILFLTFHKTVRRKLSLPISRKRITALILPKKLSGNFLKDMIKNLISC